MDRFHPLRRRLQGRRDLGKPDHLLPPLPRDRLARAIIELLSEGATLGAAGSVIMLALALPAFDETSKDWRNQGDFAVTFLDRYGNEIGQRGIIQRDSVPVDEMPDHVVNAVLATEDRRFFEHFGIDFLGLFRAMSENVRANSVVQGGSTITQQLAKNLFLSNERTVERKVKEAFLSLWLETNLSKKEILQLYLDRAYMGGGTFGIAAAADFYFGKNVKDLTLAEAAMLAGLFKAPTKYAPHINLPAARARANEVLTNMVQGGFLTEGQVLSARLHPADIVDRGDRKSPDYFLDYAFDEAKRIAAKYGIHSMVARTTIDLDLQQAAEESLEFHLRQYGKDYGVTEGAIVMLENNGAVRAHGRRPRLRRQPVQPRHQGAAAGGLVVQDLYLYGRDGSRADARNHDIRRADQLGQLVAEELWPRLCRPRYADHRASEVDQHCAGAPRQGPSVDPGDQGGGDRDGRGIAARGPQDHGARHVGHDRHGPGDRLQHARRRRLRRHPPRHHAVHDALRRGVLRLRSRRAEAEARGLRKGDVGDELDAGAGAGDRHGARAALPNIRSAGKTGTTQSYRDAWYVGFTGNYTAAVWIGNDDFHPTRNMTGGSLPAMTWQRLMEYAHKNIDLKPIPGIENPFVDAEIAAKAEEAEKREAEKSAEEAIDRPAVLSPRRPGSSRRCRRASARRRRSRRRLSRRRCRRCDDVTSLASQSASPSPADHFWVHHTFGWQRSAGDG